jgi:uncharacterized delta-60 repeat protein
MALYPDGKILIAGAGTRSRYRTQDDLASARFRPNGTLDRGFSGDGLQTVDLGRRRPDFAYSVEIQRDGRILAVESSTVGPRGSASMAVLRLNRNGTLDKGSVRAAGNLQDRSFTAATPVRLGSSPTAGSSSQAAPSKILDTTPLIGSSPGTDPDETRSIVRRRRHRRHELRHRSRLGRSARAPAEQKDRRRWVHVGESGTGAGTWPTERRPRRPTRGGRGFESHPRRCVCNEPKRSPAGAGLHRLLRA